MVKIKLKDNALFISDIHIGSSGCQSEKLLKVLKNEKISQLFLVGDIIDGWKLKRKFKISKESTKLIKKIISLSNKNTDVYYIAGNHDEFLRDFIQSNGDQLMTFGNIKFYDNLILELLDKRKMLLVHGDQYDLAIQTNKNLAKIGDIGYEMSIKANILLNKFRKFFKMKEWSLSAFLKRNVKQALNYITKFENVAIYDAMQNDCNGIICGHIHTPKSEYRKIKNNGHAYYGLYVNCGDWIDSCSYIKYNDNKFEIKYG